MGSIKWRCSNKVSRSVPERNESKGIISWQRNKSPSIVVLVSKSQAGPDFQVVKDLAKAGILVFWLIWLVF
jgi:hypothetical protein